jgi:hypothetical protein
MVVSDVNNGEVTFGIIPNEAEITVDDLLGLSDAERDITEHLDAVEMEEIFVDR